MTVDNPDRGTDISSGSNPQAATDGQWVAFQQARQDLAEVMTDEELAGLGFDLAVLDEAP